MVFSDESRFCLEMHNGGMMVRRRHRERGNIVFSIPSNPFTRDVPQTVEIMVWGAVTYGSRPRLVFDRGNMNVR